MLTGMDLSLIVLMASLFAGYLLAVRVLEVVSARLGSITFIKSVHTIVFLPLSALLFVLVYEAVAGSITYLSWIAIAVFLAEGVVLLTNHGRCPLTKYAERLGSAHGQITDFFFPKWFADRVFIVYGALFAASVLGLVVRSIV